MATMIKVVATNSDKEILVVLPYFANGAYGTWVLPRQYAIVQDDPKSLTDLANDALYNAVNYDSGLTLYGHSYSEDGNVTVDVDVDDTDWKFRCNTEVADKRYLGMKFPTYVQAQFVPIEKAVRMLRKSEAALFVGESEE